MFCVLFARSLFDSYSAYRTNTHPPGAPSTHIHTRTALYSLAANIHALASHPELASSSCARVGRFLCIVLTFCARILYSHPVLASCVLSSCVLALAPSARLPCARLICSPRLLDTSACLLYLPPPLASSAHLLILCSPPLLHCSARLPIPGARILCSHPVCSHPCARILFWHPACSHPCTRILLSHPACSHLACSHRLLASFARLVCSPHLLASSSCAPASTSCARIPSSARLVCSPCLLSSSVRLVCSPEVLASTSSTSLRRPQTAILSGAVALAELFHPPPVTDRIWSLFVFLLPVPYLLNPTGELPSGSIQTSLRS